MSRSELSEEQLERFNQLHNLIEEICQSERMQGGILTGFFVIAETIDRDNERWFSTVALTDHGTAPIPQWTIRGWLDEAADRVAAQAGHGRRY